MKHKWITLVGKADTKQNKIVYEPTYAEDNQAIKTPLAAIVASNIFFENGTVKFKVKLLDTASRCQLVLNSGTSKPNIYAGLNTNQFAFGILSYDFAKKSFDNLSVIGDPLNTDITNEIEVTVTVVGSSVDLFVDGILVASTNTIIESCQLEMFLQGDSKIEVSDIKVETVKPKAFIVMQFTNEYNELYEEVIKPVCEAHGLDCNTAAEFYTSTPILQDIITSIRESTIIIADITENNPNVFYEVGYSHSLNKPTILLSERKRDKLPFDVSGFRTIFYDNTIAGKAKVEKNLIKYLKKIL